MDNKVIKNNYGAKLFTINGFMIVVKMKSKICCIENEVKAECVVKIYILLLLLLLLLLSRLLLFMPSTGNSILL